MSEYDDFDNIEDVDDNIFDDEEDNVEEMIMDLEEDNMKTIPKDGDEDEEEDEDEDVIDDAVDVNLEQFYVKKTTYPYMNKYERTRTIGARATQIANGAPIMVDRGNLTDPVLIAEKELKERKIPIKIRRTLPDGSFEDWSVDELIIT